MATGHWDHWSLNQNPECTVHQVWAGRCTEESPEAQISDAGWNPGPLTVLTVSCHEPTEQKAKENEAKKATEYFLNGTTSSRQNPISHSLVLGCVF